MTTKDRINRCLPPGWRVWSERGVWIVYYRGEAHGEWVFREGLIILGHTCNGSVKDRRRLYARRAMLLPSVVAWAEAHQACQDDPLPRTTLRVPEDILLLPARRPARISRFGGTVHFTTPPAPGSIITLGASGFEDTGNDDVDLSGADDALVPGVVAREDESRWAEYNRKFNEMFRKPA